MSSVTSFNTSNTATSDVPLVTQISLSITDPPIFPVGINNSSSQKTHAQRSPGPEQGLEGVSLPYRCSQTTSGAGWTSFSPVHPALDPNSPTLSELTESEVEKSLPIYILPDGIGTANDSLMATALLPAEAHINQANASLKSSTNIEDSKKPESKSLHSLTNILRSSRLSLLKKKPPPLKISTQASTVNQDTHRTKRFFFPKKLCSFPKRRPTAHSVDLTMESRPSSTQPPKSKPLQTMGNLVNSSSQPTLISRKKKSTDGHYPTKQTNNRPVSQAQSSIPETYYSKTTEYNPATDGRYDSEPIDFITQSNKTSKESNGNGIPWLQNINSADSQDVIFNSPSKFMLEVQQRLCDEYHTLEKQNRKLASRFKTIESTNLHYKQLLRELESANTSLQQDNTKFMHTTIKHQFLKLETSDLSKKADSVKQKLVNKERVVSEFKRQYDELKVVKEDLFKEKEFAYIEAQHNRNKLTELSEVAKELDVLRQEDTQRKHYFNRLQQAQGDIRVILRVKSTNEESCISFLSSDKIMLTKDKRKGIFNSNNASAKAKICEFSKVFQSNVRQEEIFEETSSLAETVVDGYNACVVTYGQTGSGKSYTMFGTSPNDVGVAQRLVWRILERCNEGTHWKYSVIMTIIELYRKRVFDLIRGREVKLEDDGSRVILRDTEEVVLDSAAEVSVLLDQANSNRHKATTRLNADSSRGHVVVIVRVQGISLLDKKRESHGALMLCDTAGFDSVNRRKTIKLERMIQTSLLSLGSVLTAKRQGNTRPNYSASTLTQIMRPCLSSDAKCCLLLTCHSDRDQYPCTLQSMQFGASAMMTDVKKTKSGTTWEIGQQVVTETTTDTKGGT